MNLWVINGALTIKMFLVLLSRELPASDQQLKMVNLRVLNLLTSEHIKNKGIQNLFSQLGFSKIVFKCFKINKLKNLKLTILRF